MNDKVFEDGVWELHPVTELEHSLGMSLHCAQVVLDIISPENTHDQWRLFKLISDMRDIINNPPKV